MTSFPFRFISLLAFGAFAATISSGASRADGQVPTCGAPAELVHLANPLARTGRRLAAGEPLKIVAIGSSSTAGAGASAPAKSYPARLEAELRTIFPRADITVLNRGINGEEARDMVTRFDQDVIAEKPDLVIWQVGTNAVLRDSPIDDAGALIRSGVKQLKQSRADVILVNPQYTQKVIAKPEAEAMVELISRSAQEAHVDLFQRFAVMRYWRLTEDIAFDTFASPDGVHMNDWSYGCLGKLVAKAIAEAATRPVLTAGATAGR
jgi:acyl-CoA thioesterase-1